MYLLSSRGPSRLTFLVGRFLHPRTRVRQEECQTQYRRLSQAERCRGVPTRSYSLGSQTLRSSLGNGLGLTSLRLPNQPNGPCQGILDVALPIRYLPFMSEFTQMSRLTNFRASLTTKAYYLRFTGCYPNFVTHRRMSGSHWHICKDGAQDSMVCDMALRYALSSP